MKIDIIEVADDGVVTFDTDEEARLFLMELGFNALLKDALDDFQKRVKDRNIDEINKETVERLRQYDEWRDDENKAN